MTVEIVEFIDSLDRANPKGSDPISEGDDHVRNIKIAIQDTFKNITGQVTATHEEINNLVGLDEIVSGALPDQPTEESSLLHNVGDKWKETTTIKITGDKAFIPALAGLGNVNLYVNNDGEIVASEQSTDPTWAHGVNDHTDVEFVGSPEEDDVMIFDGTAWRSKQFGGGGTMRGIEQPANCGNFGIYPDDQGMWQYNNSGTSVVSFSVPPDVKFILTDIQSENVVWDYSDVLFDDVAVWKNVRGRHGTGNFFGQRDARPNFVIKDSIKITMTGSGRVFVFGTFVEDS